MGGKLPFNENQIKNTKLFNSYTMGGGRKKIKYYFPAADREKHNNSVEYLIWSAPFSLRKVSIVGPRLMS